MSDIITRTLECGMPLIVEPMSGVKSAALSWLLPTGCACDPPTKQGISSMWGEIVMRGTTTLSSRDQADAFDRLGVSRSTEPRVLTFRLSASMLGSRIADALPLLTQMVLEPRMDEDAIEPCRELSLAALESLADEPMERASLAARAQHFADPLCRSGLGTVEGLQSVTRQDLLELWKLHARPRGSILAIAGAVDAAAVEQQLNALLGSWNGQTPQVQYGPAARRGYSHIEDPSNQVQILVLHDAPTEGHPDSILEKIVLNVLSGGMSGRLFTQVREKRALCYSVSASYAGDRAHGTVSAYVGTTPERAQESLNVLLSELHRINSPDGVIEAAEFERAIVGMKSGLIFSGESTGARAASIAADVHRLGRARSLSELATVIESVTLDQVNAYLARRSLGQMTVQTLGPSALTLPVG